MENANLSSLTLRNELNEFEEEIEIKEEEEQDDLEQFNTFPTIEELGYHEWLLKNPRLSWVSAKSRIRIKEETIKSKNKSL
ncbi:hypothetical protein Tco_0197714 [Tanacetum coccineum]